MMTPLDYWALVVTDSMESAHDAEVLVQRITRHSITFLASREHLRQAINIVADRECLPHL